MATATPEDIMGRNLQHFSKKKVIQTPQPIYHLFCMPTAMSASRNSHVSI
jgi:hypothetical protein